MKILTKVVILTFITLSLLKCTDESKKAIQDKITASILVIDSIQLALLDIEVDMKIEVGECQEALEMINNALEKYENDSYLFSMKCRAYNCLGEPEKAIESCKKALSLDSKNVNANLNYSWAYLQLNQFDESIHYAEMVVKSNIDNIFLKGDAYNNLGAAKLKLGDNEEAKEAFKKSIKINPYSELPYIGLGQKNLFENNLEKAESYLNKAIEIKPNKALSHWVIGILKIKKGNKEEACKSLNKALQLGFGGILPNGQTPIEVATKICK